jgi:hypothetical protein
MPLRRSLPLAAAVALLLSGCAGQAGAPSGDPSASSAPSTPSASASAGPVRGGVVRPGPAPSTASGTVRTVHLVQHTGPVPGTKRSGPVWQLVRSSAGSADVRILWASSTTPTCGAPTDVYVTETADAVVLDLAGPRPRSGVACSALAVESTATVVLAQPLGSRTLEEHRIGACALPTPSTGMQPQVACPRAVGPVG